MSSGGWPKGMSELVNSPERIHGYFVNSEDIFFFVGSQKQFDQALKELRENRRGRAAQDHRP